MLTQTQELDFVIARAGDLVERDWTQGANARDASGRPLGPEDYRACSFCLLGAIRRATDELLPDHSVDTFNAMINAAFGRIETVIWRKPGSRYASPWRWNDMANRTQAEVVDVLRKARPCASYKGGAGDNPEIDVRIYTPSESKDCGRCVVSVEGEIVGEIFTAEGGYHFEPSVAPYAFRNHPGRGQAAGTLPVAGLRRSSREGRTDGRVRVRRADVARGRSHGARQRHRHGAEPHERRRAGDARARVPDVPR